MPWVTECPSLGVRWCPADGGWWGGPHPWWPELCQGRFRRQMGRVRGLQAAGMPENLVVEPCCFWMKVAAWGFISYVWKRMFFLWPLIAGSGHWPNASVMSWASALFRSSCSCVGRKPGVELPAVRAVFGPRGYLTDSGLPVLMSAHNKPRWAEERLWGLQMSYGNVYGTQTPRCPPSWGTGTHTHEMTFRGASSRDTVSFLYLRVIRNTAAFLLLLASWRQKPWCWFRRWAWWLVYWEEFTFLKWVPKLFQRSPGFGELSLRIPGVWYLHRDFPTSYYLFRVCSQSHQPHHQTPFEMLVIPSMQKKKHKKTERWCCRVPRDNLELLRKLNYIFLCSLIRTSSYKGIFKQIYGNNRKTWQGP